MSSHEIIVRYVALLRDGISTPDWSAARALIDGLSEEQAAALSSFEGFDYPGDMDEGWTDDEIAGRAPEPTVGESYRRYLQLEIARLLDSPFYTRRGYQAEYQGRRGFIVDGYGWDEEPERTIGFRRLMDAGAIEAAGYEILP